jgi:hypothetical protein
MVLGLGKVFCVDFQMKKAPTEMQELEVWILGLWF